MGVDSQSSQAFVLGTRGDDAVPPEQTGPHSPALLAQKQVALHTYLQLHSGARAGLLGGIKLGRGFRQDP